MNSITSKLDQLVSFYPEITKLRDSVDQGCVQYPVELIPSGGIAIPSFIVGYDEKKVHTLQSSVVGGNKDTKVRSVQWNNVRINPLVELDESDIFIPHVEYDQKKLTAVSIVKLCRSVKKISLAYYMGSMNQGDLLCYESRCQKGKWFFPQGKRFNYGSKRPGEYIHYTLDKKQLKNS